MSASVNGWSLISKWLGIRQKRQKYLAEILGVSNSAVSQYKKGNFLLNSEQMQIIIDALNFSQSDIDSFYAEVSNARFANGRIKSSVSYSNIDYGNSAQSKPSEVKEEPSEYFTIPRNSAAACQGRPYDFITQRNLSKFDPKQEELDVFARGVSTKKIFLPVSLDGGVALQLDARALTPGILPDSIFLLDCHSLPTPSDIAAYQLNNGKVGVLHYHKNGEDYNMVSDVDGKVMFIWTKEEAVKAVKWMYPVRAVFSSLLPLK